MRNWLPCEFQVHSVSAKNLLDCEDVIFLLSRNHWVKQNGRFGRKIPLEHFWYVSGIFITLLNFSSNKINIVNKCGWSGVSKGKLNLKYESQIKSNRKITVKGEGKLSKGGSFEIRYLLSILKFVKLINLLEQFVTSTCRKSWFHQVKNIPPPRTIFSIFAFSFQSQFSWHFEILSRLGFIPE